MEDMVTMAVTMAGTKVTSIMAKIDRRKARGYEMQATPMRHERRFLRSVAEHGLPLQH